MCYVLTDRTDIEGIPNLIRRCLKVLANCSNSSRSVISSGLGSVGRVATALSGGCVLSRDDVLLLFVRLLVLLVTLLATLFVLILL